MSTYSILHINATFYRNYVKNFRTVCKNLKSGNQKNEPRKTIEPGKKNRVKTLGTAVKFLNVLLIDNSGYPELFRLFGEPLAVPTISLLPSCRL